MKPLGFLPNVQRVSEQDFLEALQEIPAVEPLDHDKLN